MIAIRCALLVATMYYNINWQKNPVHFNIILHCFLSEVFYGVLPSMCLGQAT